MTSVTETPAPAGCEIVFFARVGPHRITLTAPELRDTIAAYLARGNSMPTPTTGDPNEALHVIAEEWLWGDVKGWTLSADVVQLATYRHDALRWITRYFSGRVPNLEPQSRP